MDSRRQLWERYRPITRARATNRMSTIIFWKFNQRDFENSSNEWENEINRYDAEASSRFPDEVKIGILIHQTTGPLQQHLQLNTDTGTPYQDLRACMIIQRRINVVNVAVATCSLQALSVKASYSQGSMYTLIQTWLLGAMVASFKF